MKLRVITARSNVTTLHNYNSGLACNIIRFSLIRRIYRISITLSI